MDKPASTPHSGGLTLTDLPDDLLQRIVGELWKVRTIRGTRVVTRSPSWAAAALTCRALRDAAYAAVTAVAVTFDARKCRCGAGGTVDAEAHRSSVVGFLGRAPNVREVLLGDPIFPPDFAFFRSFIPTLPTLPLVSLWGVSTKLAAGLNALPALSAAPLGTLEVVVYPFDKDALDELGVLLSRLSTLPSVRALTLTVRCVVFREPGPLPALLAAIPPWWALRSLTVWGVADAETVDALVRAVPALTSLSLPMVWPHTALAGLADPAVLPALKRVDVNLGVGGRGGGGENPNGPAHVAARVAVAAWLGKRHLTSMTVRSDLYM